MENSTKKKRNFFFLTTTTLDHSWRIKKNKKNLLFFFFYFVFLFFSRLKLFFNSVLFYARPHFATVRLHLMWWSNKYVISPIPVTGYYYYTSPHLSLIRIHSLALTHSLVQKKKTTTLFQHQYKSLYTHLTLANIHTYIYIRFSC